MTTSYNVTTSYNTYVIRAFEAFFRPWMGRRISARYIRGSVADLPKDRRVILVANHVSWWDAFLIRELHRLARTGQPLYTLMGAQELARFPLFRMMGVIGLSHEPANVTHALRRLRADDFPYWLTLFPQGRIWPSWKRPLAFRRGAELFAREISPCTVIPVAVHLEPLTNPAPSAFVGIGEPLHVEAGGTIQIAVMERSVEALLDEMFDVLAAHGEEAGAAWTGIRSYEAATR